MQIMKRILSSLLVVMMIAAMLVIPANADATHSITISGASGHSFTAYQIFTGDLSGAVLSNIVWGDGVDSAALLTALKGDATIGGLFTGCDTAPQVAAVLEADTWTEAQTIAFAKVVAGRTTTAKGTGAESGTDYVISGLEPGYYIVKDTSSLDGANDAYSRYIIQVTSNTAVAIKKAMPTLIKKVSLAAGSGFSEAISAGIGNTVYFALSARMHERIGDYTTYKLVFEDELPTGMNYVGVEAVYVNTTKLADTSAVAVTNPDNKYHFTIENAKAVISAATNNAAVAATDRITIVYSARIDGDAGWVYGGAGNKNTAVLNYSNDPNGGSAMGQTAAVDATVYTYQLVINKTDASTGTPLQGAVFTVSFMDDGGVTKYVKAAESAPGSGVYTATDTTVTAGEATKMTSNTAGQITVKGLREREYMLTEITAPDSYNKINDVQYVFIDPDINADTGELTALSATKNGTYTTVTSTDKVTGTVTVTIINHQGAVLPTTGGMGTTIFYLVGGILIVGAAAVLLTKKRSTQK